MRLTRIFCFILFWIVSLICYATEQAPDSIIFNGKSYFTHSYPLEAFFETNNELRSDAPTTALWRGYKANFEIEDSLLYIMDIKTYENGKYISIKNEIFALKDSIIADFFSGTILLSNNRSRFYWSKKKENMSKDNYLIEINNGKVIKLVEFVEHELDSIKEKQFLAFKKTDQFQQLCSKNNWCEMPDDEFLIFNIFSYTEKILFDIEQKDLQQIIEFEN